ncbi:MAG: hypothetical protein HGN29_17835 [Asgard group archaeon]|nr:hypothetical protein [Asgard group archaeon]
MRKGKRRIKNIFSFVFILFFILVVFSKLSNCQINPEAKDLEKENPIAIYIAENVFPVDDLLIVSMGLGLEFFNNTNKEDPLYLGRPSFNPGLYNYKNVEDQIFSIGSYYNATNSSYYTYFAIYNVKNDVSLELVRNYTMPDAYKEFIILENNTSLVLLVNKDRQSLSLFNCTEEVEDLSIQYTHESFFNSNDDINAAIYKDGYLCLSTYETNGDNNTLAIFDMTNHTKLELLKSWSSDSNYFHYYDIAIEENRMYLVSRNGFAKVFNITENETFQEIGVFDTNQSYGYLRIHENFAFFLKSDELIIYNITDLENVEQLGSYQRGENQGSYEIFFIINDLIYISHFATRTDNLLIMIDWSDHTNLVFIRIFGFPHTDNNPAFVLAVPVVFLVFVFGLKKRNTRRSRKINKR